MKKTLIKTGLLAIVPAALFAGTLSDIQEQCRRIQDAGQIPQEEVRVPCTKTQRFTGKLGEDRSTLPNELTVTAAGILKGGQFRSESRTYKSAMQDQASYCPVLQEYEQEVKSTKYLSCADVLSINDLNQVCEDHLAPMWDRCADARRVAQDRVPFADPQVAGTATVTAIDAVGDTDTATIEVLPNPLNIAPGSAIANGAGNEVFTVAGGSGEFVATIANNSTTSTFALPAVAVAGADITVTFLQPTAAEGDQTLTMITILTFDLSTPFAALQCLKHRRGGRGIRCLARYLADTDGDAPGRSWDIETLAGMIRPELMADGQLRVDMGPPFLTSEGIPKTSCPAVRAVRLNP